MLFSNYISIVVVLAAPGLAFPTLGLFRRHVTLPTSVFESLSTPPKGWAKDDSAEVNKNDSTLKLRIHLVQQNKDKFHDLAMNIATPGHELYGAHLSQKTIDNMMAPLEESKDLVMQWLTDAGMSKYASLSPRSDTVIVEASISEIETLLKTEYSAFVETKTGTQTVRTLEYSLPDVLKGHVDMVQPTTFFGLKSLRSTISAVRPASQSKAEVESIEAVTGCSGSTITPKCLSNLYSFVSATNHTAGRMGIAGFLEQYPSKSDLTKFLTSNAIDGNTKQTYTCALINGGTCPTPTSSNVGVEANLDVQYARAITQFIPNVFYSTGGSPPIVGGGTNDNEPYLEFLNYLLALDNSALPNTLSISYGDDESTVPLSYADQTCTLFAQLGARGVSVTVSSGDSGVGDTCPDNLFQTAYPASCPWVTTVGGTTGVGPESGWTDGGGGFSSVFGRASYQNAAVTNWLTTDTTHAGVASQFNSSGRAYPDVAAQATNFVIEVSGSSTEVDGTSCSSPTFASIIQLLNSDRIANGKSPLGFLNPWLYANATTGFTDITKGGNTGCGGGAGFSAVKGWDPATGLGTPNYAKLLAISNAT